VKGYKVIVTMPDSMSMERRSLLSAYGAELALTPAEGKMEAAIDMVEKLKAEHPNHFVPSQFNNPKNPETHRKFTAAEIFDVFWYISRYIYYWRWYWRDNIRCW
jgi:cysteine synthase A